jgi:hypothetical protein
MDFSEADKRSSGSGALLELTGMGQLTRVLFLGACGQQGGVVLRQPCGQPLDLFEQAFWFDTEVVALLGKSVGVFVLQPVSAVQFASGDLDHDSDEALESLVELAQGISGALQSGEAGLDEFVHGGGVDARAFGWDSTALFFCQGTFDQGTGEVLESAGAFSGAV